jgi:hypothetical protein
VSTSNGEINIEEFSIKCRHQDFIGFSLNISEVYMGRSDFLPGQGSAQWGGGFRGRPELASQLREAISISLGAYKPGAFRSNLSGFRSFWRLLDMYEKNGMARVDSLKDILLAHGVLWLRSERPPAASHYAIVRDVIRTARDMENMEPLCWPSIRQKQKKLGDVPTPEQARRIYIELKRRVHAANEIWLNSEKLALSGRNLLKISMASRPHNLVSAADLHATYRALITRTGNPIPAHDEFMMALGHTFTSQKQGVPKLSSIYKRAGIGFRALVKGIYPQSRDLQDFFHLFLIQTGWNPQVVLDIDITNSSWATKIGDPTTDIYRISSYKVRSGEWQRTICRGKPSHSPYQLILRLMMRTQALRDAAEDGRLACDAPAIARRSPWLFADISDGVSVGILHDRSYPKSDRVHGPRFLTKLSLEINSKDCEKHEALCCDAMENGSPKPDPPILMPTDIKAGDFRDIYIGNEFLQSGYNLVIAKLAAGHSNMGTIIRYLRSRAWRRHSEGSVRRLMDHLWGELEVHRVCDPAILRALCDRGVITQSQRERWSLGKDKTYLGMGCVDPKHPPRSIDPTNDGNQLCRSQHRCTLCEHGIVFPDSLSDLAKRLAELETIQLKMSASSWSRAEGLQLEKSKLIRTLDQFDSHEVIERKEYWHKRIVLGYHFPLEWDGIHA